MPLTNEDVRQLAYATMQNDLDKMDAILASQFSYIKNPEVNKYGSYFVAACVNGLHMVVDKYLDYRQFQQCHLDTGLYEASVIGDRDTANILVKRCKLDLNKAIVSSTLHVGLDGEMVSGEVPRYPIELAANNENPELVEYYLSQPGIAVDNIFSGSFTTGLTPFVIACMGGKGFLPLVKRYIERREFEKDKLYQAIYLAARFENAGAIKLIIDKCDRYLDSDVAIKVMEQGFSDAKVYLAQPGNKEKSTVNKQKDAVNQMRSKLASIVGHVEHEHSSDEERAASGSHSPGHSTDSDPESAGSNNSPPRSPEKLAQPSKPLSEKAQKLLTRKGTPDKALRQAFMSDAGADVINELCDLGLTFEEVDDDPKVNIFQKRVLICTKDASIILSKYPQCLNSVNSDGQTAAHLVALEKVDRSLPAHKIKAEEHYRIDRIKFLIEKGANIHTADNFGRFPLDYAWAAQMSELAVFIEDNRPKPPTRSIQRQPQEITYTSQSSSRPSVPVSVQLANSKAALLSAPVQPQQLPSVPQRQVAMQPPPRDANGASIGTVHAAPPQTAANAQYQQHKKKGVFGSILDKLPGSKKEVSKPAKVAP